VNENAPSYVRAAAAVVRDWLDAAQKPTPLSREEIDKMTPAEKLDYARRFDQSQLPEWRDPREQTERKRYA
jgi:hypothetical protein